MEITLNKALPQTALVGESGPNEALTTIADIVAFRAENEPEKEAFTYLIDGENESINWNYRDLKNAVAYVSNEISNKFKKNDRILLMFEPGLAFIAAYLATISCGAIAVPCHPPMGSRQIKRLLDMIQNCQPSVILYSDFIQKSSPQLSQFTSMAQAMGIQLVAVDVPANPVEQKWLRPELNPDDLAMLQYTSASTGNPKGVMVTQENLVKNCAAIYHWLGEHPARKGCIWLPPYHDMGLLGGIMQPLYAGFPLVFMSPMHFVQKPLRWLKALSDHRLTTTGAPNFALQLCVDEVSEEDIEKANLDLSCVREIFCGSEPINPQTVAAFEKKYREYGLSKTALNPCYGLAEATLFVSGKPALHSLKTSTFSMQNIDMGKVESPVNLSDERNIVSCGLAGKELDIRIVNPETHELLTENNVGEVWISGPSIAKGYWRQKELTETAFGNTIEGIDGSFYRTGDLGFFSTNELYITGRIKEVVIIRGRNLYPQDIERCALSSSDLLSNSMAAAFAVPGEATENLVLVIACRQNMDESSMADIRVKIENAIRNEFNVTPFHIHIGPRKTIPRTTSGKIQRTACKDLYLKGKLETFAEAEGIKNESV